MKEQTCTYIIDDYCNAFLSLPTKKKIESKDPFPIFKGVKVYGNVKDLYEHNPMTEVQRKSFEQSLLGNQSIKSGGTMAYCIEHVRGIICDITV